MANTIISFDAAGFLSGMRRRSFAFVGAAMLIRAHLTLAPRNRLTRAAVHGIFNSRTAPTIALIDEVLDMAFRIDDSGLVFSPGVDRAVAQGEPSVQAGACLPS